MVDPVVSPVQKALDKVATKKWFQFATKAKAQKGDLEPVSVAEQVLEPVPVAVVKQVPVKKNSRLFSCFRRSVDVIEPLVVREVAAAVAPVVAAVDALVSDAVPSADVPSAEVPSAEVPSAEVPSAEVLAAALVDAAVSAVADALDVALDAAANPVSVSASAQVPSAPQQLEMVREVVSAELPSEDSQIDSPVESVSGTVEESAKESATPVVPVESQ